MSNAVAAAVQQARHADRDDTVHASREKEWHRLERACSRARLAARVPFKR
jgi:hypothetical protein